MTFSDESLKQLSQEVMALLKQTTGVEAFSAVYAAAQKARHEKKEKRKQKRAIAVSKQTCGSKADPQVETLPCHIGRLVAL